MANYVERKARRDNGAPMMSRPRPPWWLRDEETAKLVLHGPFVELRRTADYKNTRDVVLGRDLRGVDR